MIEARTASPSDIHSAVQELKAGDRLELAEGDYTQPIVLSSLVGTETDRIVITGLNAVIGPKATYESYKHTANQLAAAQEAGGRFPGLYYLADNAAFVLKNCQWVDIEDLIFDGCWPTAVYLENCQHITLSGLKINGGTFAIGATGTNTRHILVRGCDWVQDPSGNGWEICVAIRDKRPIENLLEGPPSKLWKEIDWARIHGERGETKRAVDVDNDERGYDGDFFRAWSIAGYVVIENNVVVDAFNGVHFFNQTADSIVDSCSRNVLIQNNWFIRIRDNAIEPEDFTWNWTVRHNKIIDCYMPFSFEMGRSGYFYVYGNLGWNQRKPGPTGDLHTGGQLFKFPATHVADGPHCVFNNSWMLRAPVAKKKRFSNFVHVNNAIDYYESDTKATAPFGKNFRDTAPIWIFTQATLDFEAEHFTKGWRQLGIRFDGDVIHHPWFPDEARAAGFPIGPIASGQSPDFVNKTSGRPEGLKTTSKHPATGLEILLPDTQTQTAVDPQKNQVGAWQGDALITVRDPVYWTYWPGRIEISGSGKSGDLQV